MTDRQLISRYKKLEQKTRFKRKLARRCNLTIYAVAMWIQNESIPAKHQGKFEKQLEDEEN